MCIDFVGVETQNYGLALEALTQAHYKNRP